MIDGLFTIIVMPIFICGVIFIFAFNALCSLFGYREYKLSQDNFCHFIDYYKYPIGALQVVFLLILIS
jgi:hypothetical protein